MTTFLNRTIGCEKNFAKSRRFGNGVKFGLVPWNAQILRFFNFFENLHFRVYTASMSLLDSVFTFWPNLAKKYDDDDDVPKKQALLRHISAIFSHDSYRGSSLLVYHA